MYCIVTLCALYPWHKFLKYYLLYIISMLTYFITKMFTLYKSDFPLKKKSLLEHKLLPSVVGSGDSQKKCWATKTLKMLKWFFCGVMEALIVVCICYDHFIQLASRWHFISERIETKQPCTHH